jgi:hypothetical protein
MWATMFRWLPAGKAGEDGAGAVEVNDVERGAAWAKRWHGQAEDLPALALESAKPMDERVRFLQEEGD